MIFFWKESMKKCKIISVKSLGKQDTFNLTMKADQHNYAVSGSQDIGKFIISRNSHAVAYTYISSWLLYLKAHYPPEFYAAILSCETLSEKIKEYKMEAKIHGIEMERLDINKSKENFDLQGDTIYFGLSNVKGIGEAPAKRIVQGQPYKSFEDFLDRFGTDASVLKPLLGLRCFKDRDPVTLWKFSEHYKACKKKIDDKKKRYLASLEKYNNEFKSILPDEYRSFAEFETLEQLDQFKEKLDHDELIEKIKEKQCLSTDEGAESRIIITEVDVQEGVQIELEDEKFYRKVKTKVRYNRWTALNKLWKKRQLNLEKYSDNINQTLPKLAKFNAEKYSISDVLAKDLSDLVACEEKYYGFAWIHELEKSPDYQGNLTFDVLKSELDTVCGPVEIKVVKSMEIKSKKGTIYHQIIAEDVTGEVAKINVWEEDWNWWGSVFTPGALLRIRLQVPSGGFSTYTLESNQIGFKRGNKKYKFKDDDIRVIVYKQGEDQKEKFLTDEEIFEQFNLEK